MTLPADIEGEVVMHLAGDGTAALDGWVASFEGHRLALDTARSSPGVRRLDDRLMIVLGRPTKRR